MGRSQGWGAAYLPMKAPIFYPCDWFCVKLVDNGVVLGEKVSSSHLTLIDVPFLALHTRQNTLKVALLHNTGQWHASPLPFSTRALWEFWPSATYLHFVMLKAAKRWFCWKEGSRKDLPPWTIYCWWKAKFSKCCFKCDPSNTWQWWENMMPIQGKVRTYNKSLMLLLDKCIFAKLKSDQRIYDNKTTSLHVF